MFKIQEFLAKAKGRTNLVWLRHRLMKHYGWIPIEQFKKIKLTELWGLIECINQQEEIEAKMWKTKPKGVPRIKRPRGR